MPSEMAEQRITEFHEDESGEWVADLECGHGQHVRHRPPWEMRPWVITAEGREQHLGMMLCCKKCDKDISGEGERWRWIYGE